jgi:hypothetical protein
VAVAKNGMIVVKNILFGLGYELLRYKGNTIFLIHQIFLHFFGKIFSVVGYCFV